MLGADAGCPQRSRDRRRVPHARLRNWLEKNTGREVPFYFVQGTEYHEGRGAEELESIAARVKGATIQSNFSGRYCKEILDLAVDGVVINFAHHLGGGSGFTRSGVLDAE